MSVWDELSSKAFINLTEDEQWDTFERMLQQHDKNFALDEPVEWGCGHHRQQIIQYAIELLQEIDSNRVQALLDQY